MIPTLKSLAAELGLTPAAVSMALRNHPRISQGTRTRVRALAKKRGYVPNPAFSRAGGWGKKAPRTGMPLAVVHQPHPVIGHGISTYISTLKKVVRGFGYELQSHECLLGQAERVGNILYARGVEAVILWRIFDPNFISDFPWERFSVVALDAGYYRPPCHLVMPDIAAATLDAVNRALELGFRRLGLYEFEEKVTPVDWVDRFGSAAAAQEICRARKAALYRGHGPPYDREAFRRWLARVKPDIVLGQTPSCFWWLRELAGDRQPTPCISLQMDPSEKDFGLAGFVHDNEAMATVAIKLLDAEVRNFERGKPLFPTRQIVSMPWHEGEGFQRFSASAPMGRTSTLREVDRRGRRQLNRFNK